MAGRKNAADFVKYPYENSEKNLPGWAGSFLKTIEK